MSLFVVKMRITCRYWCPLYTVQVVLHVASMIITEHLVLIIHFLHFFHTSLTVVTQEAPQYDTQEVHHAASVIISGCNYKLPTSLPNFTYIRNTGVYTVHRSGGTLLHNVHCYTSSLLLNFLPHFFHTSLPEVTQKAPQYIALGYTIQPDL